MSDEGSPTLLNLRGFRMQPKPALTHNMNNSVLDSSSEEVAPAPRKRIMKLFSESDSEEESQTHQLNSPPNNINILSPPSSTIDSNGLNDTPDEKKKQIKLREKMVRYLMYSFPDTPTFEIYEALSKTKFTLDDAKNRLIGKNQRIKPNCFDFPTWSDKEGSLPPSTFLVKPQTTLQRTINKQKSTFQKITESSPLKRKDISPIREQSSYKKIKRKPVDSDDSDDGHQFKESKVFDSDDDSDNEISNELTPEKKRVLEYFQSATANELQQMSTCSKKKVDTIISLRPFLNWFDLVQKLQNNKNLNTDLLNYAQRVLATRNNIQQLMKKCAKLSEQLELAVNQGAGLKRQPAILSSELKLTSYQLVGLNWLTILHKEGVNGILADEMGLGKTVQVISFLAHLKESNAAKNTHLVVVPSSTLENWQNEFDRWCPALKVLLYYGSVEERRSFRILFANDKHKEYDVILTTYTMISSGPEERKMFRVTPMHYVVFDEAHMLKNMNTQRYEALVRIKAANRILLTGTPLQNNLLELMSLLIFVMPNIFSEKTEDLKNLFQKNAKVKDDDTIPSFEREQIEQAKRIMKPFLLRRLKRDVLQDLPKKSDYKLDIPMVASQEKQYMELVSAFKAAGDSGAPGYSGVTMMTELRKLSNHPCLLRYYYKESDLEVMAKKLAADPGYKDTVVQYIIDDLVHMSDFEIHTMTQDFKCLQKYALPDELIVTSGKFQFLDKKLAELKKDGHRVVIFSQYVIMLNVMEEYLRIRDHSFLRLDGSTPVNIRQQLIDEFTEDQSIFIFLLSTRAGGLGINLTSADTVIIHDIDFNPYNDKQAEDRCHRMGQKKPVSVYRLISHGTIEDNMWQMTQEKLKLEKEMTSEVNENTDLRSVVSLLSSALGVNSSIATNLVSPTKKL